MSDESAYITDELLALDFLQGLITDSADARTAATDELEDQIFDADGSVALEIDVLRKYFPTIVRFSEEAPFADVRSRFSEWVARLRKAEPSLPQRLARPVPSAFCDPAAIVPIDSSDKNVQKCFVETFLNYAYVTHVVRLLAWHPKYLRRFRASMDLTMRGSGPLPVPWRFYIGIMAAARHRCNYMMDIDHSLFLAAGGSDVWLSGLETVPAKLANLAQLNALLAHRPWDVQTQHIRDLVTGDARWSVNELLHAILLMVMTHGLSSFVWGCGVVGELQCVDAPNAPLARRSAIAKYTANNARLEQFLLSSSTSSSASPSGGGGSLQGSAPIATVSASSAPGAVNARSSAASGSSPQPATGVDAAAAAAAAADASSGVSSESASLLTSTSDAPTSKAPSKFLPDEDNTYTRFTGSFPCVYEEPKQGSRGMRGALGWNSTAFPFLQRMWPEAAACLDKQFHVAQEMTYRRLFRRADIDTAPLRAAVWQYAQRVVGFVDSQVGDQPSWNKILGNEIKLFIKLVVSAPDEVRLSHYNNIGLELDDTERCHIVILACEARKQATLCHVLGVLSEFLASNAAT